MYISLVAHLITLYFLAVGVSTKNDNHLKFLFEMNEEFSLLPTYAVIPAMGVSMGMGMGGIPGLEINPTMVRSSNYCCDNVVFAGAGFTNLLG